MRISSLAAILEALPPRKGEKELELFCPARTHPHWQPARRRERITCTSRKLIFCTGSKGPYAPDGQPVQTIRCKRPPPPFAPVRLQTGAKGGTTWPSVERLAGDLLHRFVIRTGTKGPPRVIYSSRRVLGFWFAFFSFQFFQFHLQFNFFSI